VFIAEGKGGRQRQVNVSRRFFAALADYLDQERPDAETDRVFVVLKRPRRGQPLSADGLDDLSGARGAEPASVTEPVTSCGIPA
jgi:integrase/recombinase XerD